MAACTTYRCDVCGRPIESNRTRLEITVGNLAGMPTDISTGRTAIDLCAGCRDGLTDYLTERRATNATPAHQRRVDRDLVPPGQ